MTTIVDPLGTPSIIYNKSGKTIRSIVANASGSFADAVEITHVSEDTVVLVDTTGASGNTCAVYFDASFDVGDAVTIWLKGDADNLNVYNSDGAGIGTAVKGSGGTSPTNNQFLKTSSSTPSWVIIG